MFVNLKTARLSSAKCYIAIICSNMKARAKSKPVFYFQKKIKKVDISVETIMTGTRSCYTINMLRGSQM